MGCGKTTTGKKLAKKLGYNFLDLDIEIEKHEQTTIAKIFESQGEAYFRKLEHQFLTAFNCKNNTVISCGGGTPCFYNNMEMMNNIGYTVYIQMSAEALFSRLKQAKTTRPLLHSMNDEALKHYIEDKLNERESVYQLSNISINGINLNVDELVQLILTTK
jgi:shikimate kinase